MAREFTILKGLPSYGPEATSFPPGRLLAREGLVVRFNVANNQHWVGNFERGDFDIGKVLNHPDGKHLIVCAGGVIYFVDTEERSVSMKFNSYVFYAQELPQFDTVVMGNSFEFFAIDAAGVRWTTLRISWDGFRRIELSKNILTGEAFSPIDDKWHPFKVNLQNGICEDGVYEAQIANFKEITKKY